MKEANGGHTTPEAIVEDARPKGSALHREFTWDLKECARKWNLQEAQHLLNSYVVVYQEAAGPPHEVLGNIRVVEAAGTPDQRRVYVSAEAAMKDPGMRAQVLADADRYLAGAQERLRLIRSAEAEVSVIQGIRDRLRKMAAFLAAKAKGRPPKAGAGKARC